MKLRSKPASPSNINTEITPTTSLPTVPEQDTVIDIILDLEEDFDMAQLANVILPTPDNTNIKRYLGEVYETVVYETQQTADSSLL
jgi:hypothetical protein